MPSEHLHGLSRCSSRSSAQLNCLPKVACHSAYAMPVACRFFFLSASRFVYIAPHCALAGAERSSQVCVSSCRCRISQHLMSTGGPQAASLLWAPAHTRSLTTYIGYNRSKIDSFWCCASRACMATTWLAGYLSAEDWSLLFFGCRSFLGEAACSGSAGFFCVCSDRLPLLDVDSPCFTSASRFFWASWCTP